MVATQDGTKLAPDPAFHSTSPLRDHATLLGPSSGLLSLPRPSFPFLSPSSCGGSDFHSPVRRGGQDNFISPSGILQQRQNRKEASRIEPGPRQTTQPAKVWARRSQEEAEVERGCGDGSPVAGSWLQTRPETFPITMQAQFHISKCHPTRRTWVEQLQRKNDIHGKEWG